MNKGSTGYVSESGWTVGMDVGDRYCHVCVLDEAARVVEEARVPTTQEALRRKLSTWDASLVVIEVGGHSRWLSRLIEELGHTCLIANAYEARLLAGKRRKNDRLDAETLARFGRSDPKMLRPLQHRGEQAAADLALVMSRASLVSARTELINRVRGVVKAYGKRLPACDADYFPRKVTDLIPDVLVPALQPLLETISMLSAQISALDQEVERLGEERYPETRVLRQISGVGPLVSLAFVLTVEDPQRFPNSRSVGSYLGLVPRQSQSGDSDPQLGITKAGNSYLRRLLVQAAHYITGRNGPDTDLKRWAEARSGSKAARKRSIVAVARKLSVLLHRLWLTGEVYEPLRQASRREAAA